MEKPPTIYFWFRCPDCGQGIATDEDQALGRESVICLCGYAEIGYVQPLVRITELFDENQEFSLVPKGS